jgi:hypothetical protein
MEQLEHLQELLENEQQARQVSGELGWSQTDVLKKSSKLDWSQTDVLKKSSKLDRRQNNAIKTQRSYNSWNFATNISMGLSLSKLIDD